MSAALIWLVLGLVLVAAEVISGEFVLLMLGGGALLGALAAFIVPGPVVGTVVFAVASVLLVFAVRPALKRRLHREIDPAAMHHKALLGRRGVVVQRIGEDGGRVKIDGDVWSARAYDGEQEFEEGDRVTVVEISGATAFVTHE